MTKSAPEPVTPPPPEPLPATRPLIPAVRALYTEGDLDRLMPHRRDDRHATAFRADQ